MKEIKENKQEPIIIISSSLGMLSGLALAYKQKKKFWGYVGFAILGSISGSLIGNIVNSINKK